MIVRTVFAVRMAKTEEPTSSTCTGNKEGGDDMSSSPSAASNRDKEVDAHQHEPPAQNSLITASKQNMFPRYADHTYHDFAAYLKDGGTIEKHKKSDRNFPARLHAILSDEQYSHIIAWMPHGRAWKVLNKKLLVEEVIPEFFGQSKFASFTRQLSGWGFKRLHQTGPDVGCYYHECFLQGHPRLTVLMRRISPGQGKANPNVHAEPDFYSIAKQYPLGKSEDVAGEAAAAAPTNDQWDPHQRGYSHPPHHAAHAAAANQYDGNSANQHTNSRSVARYHSSSRVAASEARKEGEGRTEPRGHDYSYHPMSNPHYLDSYLLSSMQARQEAIMNQYYASNFNQHTTTDSFLQAASAQYFHHHHPQYSQQPNAQQVHEYNLYRNPYYSNIYNGGQIPGQSQGQASRQVSRSAAQMNYPAQEYNHPLPPDFSSYESYFEGKSKEQELESDVSNQYYRHQR